VIGPPPRQSGSLGQRTSTAAPGSFRGLAKTDGIETPALLVDEEIFDENLRRADELARPAGKLLRPHVKTHRAPELALRQLDGHAASGITCQTVGEAEVMVASGVGDVLVANEVVSPGKLAQLAALARDAHVVLAVDALEPLSRLSAEAARAASTIGVLIDVDVGLGRCGVADAGEAAYLAARCRKLPGVRFEGVMGYEGRLRAHEPDRAERVERAFARLAAVLAALRGSGIEAATVSASGTSTMLEALRDPNVTEIQAGCYAVMEPELEALPLPFRCAVAVAATVVSRKPGRIVVDAGRKSVGCDQGAPVPLGLRAEVSRVSEEHVVLACDGAEPELGELVYLRPTHVRTTFNLHDDFWLVRQGVPTARVAVAARGRSR